ncbi:hypothetical protein PVX_111115 [Plasmodium vivax]|uniref:Uncharacterized protein n=1 Tax=Plasmodium vivax (strain Salvador I) TaxID=126793 RepID=A5KDX5_PLAVS|nr:hypothetical protein PVX_111115 [Plasmodium vivax]EDL42424.1 hypothetical protein PVX_111115 [Plasmodium vivax]|eukprot:XP_001608448.1 hypothetical protein [Plasmodium vivax Sal-1]
MQKRKIPKRKTQKRKITKRKTQIIESFPVHPQMNDFVHEDIELKRRAWALHFSERRTNSKFKFAKRGRKKYVTTWVKQKDQTDLFERWVKKTQLNEKYKPEDDQLEGHSDKAKLEREDPNITPQRNWTRRSTRINLQSILDKETYRRCYVDPPSDFSVEDDEEEQEEEKEGKKAEEKETEQKKANEKEVEEKKANEKEMEQKKASEKEMEEKKANEKEMEEKKADEKEMEEKKHPSEHETEHPSERETEHPREPNPT